MPALEIKLNPSSTTPRAARELMIQPVLLSSHRDDLDLLDDATDIEISDVLDDAVSSRSADILWVGDLAAGRTLNSLLLSHAGYQVDEADDGPGGCRMAKSNHYDLIVVDRLRQGASRMHFLDSIRAAGVASPVVLISDTESEIELCRNRWREKAAVLSKPFTVEQLLETVTEVLQAGSPLRHCHRAGNRASVPLCHRRDAYRHWGINE